MASLQARPTSGQRALINSGTAWGAFNAAMLLVATEPDDASTVGLSLIGGQAAGVGLGAGAYLAWRMPRVSRAQTLVIDAAGIVGAVAGGAGGVMATGDVEDRTTAGLAAVGAAIGLGAAAYFTLSLIHI